MQLMESLERIAADFDRLMPIKSELMDMSRDLEHVANEGVITHINDTASIWQEEASVQFVRKEEELRDRIIDEQRVLVEILEDINTASELLYKAEQFSRSLAVGRRY